MAAISSQQLRVDCLPTHQPNTKTALERAYVQRDPLFLLIVLCKTVFDLKKVTLDTKPFQYQKFTDDFGKEIKTMMMRVVDPNSKNASPFERVITQLGIKVLRTAEWYFPRDNFIRLPNGQIGTNMKLKHMDAAVRNCIKRNQHLKICAGEITTHHQLALAYGTAYLDSCGQAAYCDAKKYFSERRKDLPCYLEGGNLFVLSDQKKEIKLLMGEDLLYLVLNHCALNQIFYTPVVNEKIMARVSLEIQKLDQQQMVKIIQEMQAQNFKIDKEEQGNTSAIYQAYQWYIKEHLFARIFSIPSKNIHLMTPIDYHLDCFMLPGPKGSMFLQDFELCHALLKGIQKYAAALSLDPNERHILTRYIDTAEKLGKELQHLFKKSAVELRVAGFTVIPFPGIFFDRDPTEFKGKPEEARTLNIHFLNAVTGWSSKTHQFFFITTDTPDNSRLSILLKQCLEEFLEQYQIGIDVFFIDGNANQYGEKSWGWNAWKAGRAGVHCFTFDSESTDHIG